MKQRLGIAETLAALRRPDWQAAVVYSTCERQALAPGHRWDLDVFLSLDRARDRLREPLDRYFTNPELWRKAADGTWVKVPAAS